MARAIRVAEEGATTIRESLPALSALADRVLARAVALVRGRPPRGVAPEDIDGFLARHSDRLRALVTATFSQRAA